MLMRFAINNRIRVVVCLAVMAFFSGCAHAPKQTIPYPVYSDSSCEAAIEAGAQAISDCSREQVLAKLENRSPDYSKAKERLANALAVLKPGKVSPARPEYERAALCFETALDGIARIIIGQNEKDEYIEALGWEIFDRSTTDLMLVLEQGTGAGPKGSGRIR